MAQGTDDAAAGDGPAGDAVTDTEKGDSAIGEVRGVETPKGRPCPLCGASMDHRHCKYVCPEHGVVYDCSDTFY